MAAQVSFAHKTGLTLNYGSDAGIVTALPGQDGRRYIVAVFSNLGSRYSDASQAVGSSPAAAGVSVSYSQKFAQLGEAIDDLLRRDRVSRIAERSIPVIPDPEQPRRSP